MMGERWSGGEANGCHPRPYPLRALDGGVIWDDVQCCRRKPTGEHAGYPATFDPITPGHLDIIERARHLFARITVLVAVNGDKQPATAQSERAIQLRRELPANWDNVSVAAWAGLTVEFCRLHNADVIIRGVRNRTDLPHEYQLAAVNEALGITTLLLPANPRLAAVSSTVLRGLSICDMLRGGVAGNWAAIDLSHRVVSGE